MYVPIIGRVKELAILKEQTHKIVASFILIRGRRRIGKIRLIEEFCKPFLSYKFMCLAPRKERTNQDQINEFLRQLCEQFGLSKLSFNDWSDEMLLIELE